MVEILLANDTACLSTNQITALIIGRNKKIKCTVKKINLFTKKITRNKLFMNYKFYDYFIFFVLFDTFINKFLLISSNNKMIFL